jgi:beta-xylosidase
VGDQNGAVASMSTVASSCQSAQGQGKGGPVFPFDFPDPEVVRVGSTYYGYATNSATGNIQMIQSTDLAEWKVLGDALPHLAAWARPGGTWAPGVFELNGGSVLYYTAIDRLTGKHCISVAVAPQPQGPFVDSSTSPLVCQLDLGGSIDPSPFVDAGGTPYLTWKSEGVNGRPPTIWSQQLGADGITLVGQAPAPLIQPSQGWEAGVVEGPSMLPWSGQYFLFYSANNWDSASYAIGVAVCQGPTGPCSKPFDHSIVLSQGTAMSGPGGPSLFTDTQGGLWIAFHAWLPSAVGYPHSRLLFLRQVTFTNRLPVVQSTS